MPRKQAHAKIQLPAEHLTAAEKVSLPIVTATMFVLHMEIAVLITRMFAKQKKNVLLKGKLAEDSFLKIQPSAATAFIVNIPQELQMFPENAQKIKLNAKRIRIARKLNA